jgi:hypothetical protein
MDFLTILVFWSACPAGLAGTCSRRAREVSSTQLWQVLLRPAGERFWQRLKRNLLLFQPSSWQLWFSLARPCRAWRGFR